VNIGNRRHYHSGCAGSPICITRQLVAHLQVRHGFGDDDADGKAAFFKSRFCHQMNLGRPYHHLDIRLLVRASLASAA